MKNFFLGFIFGLLLTLLATYILEFYRPKIISPISKNITSVKNKALEKYQIKNLQKITFQPQSFTIKQTLKEDKNFSSYLYYLNIDTKSLGYKKNYRVSGLINIPKTPGAYPLILMLRGFVPLENYETGMGTKRAGETLAANGFITVAPDFLGYGKSEYPPADVFEARFLNYVTALSILKSAINLNQNLADGNITGIKIDYNKIGIWGHSNGGQIALTVLEIENKIYPTVLWAPVSKPFPYNILFYTDEYEDEGRLLRKKLAEFEKDYDARLFSITKYLSEIDSPIQLHQGTADGEVLKSWSDSLYDYMKAQKKEINYFVYNNENHNFSNGNWNTLITRDISFFNNSF
ncbi:hypothetical protein A3J15_03635 [Candidatus Roizmanbacteria bacterium RIFCSPLOWO2_02_FULL_38_10]|uniref:Peptidase S9 prolyl oligopeptidase catalytic domain-containing protein n=1 Tax=Candidatus Roizmanbacteria bacterium RIFCSPLOWO2_02_FULL_38_10 TaxID=1802074 RepID=A0A1F7JJW0_9BACT|nr:MAG: hypothetical protein A3J15_03635 [Candidatus Roizmanbacteria bacterium RIFCSPLOWO2_02_FULL_38_10]